MARKRPKTLPPGVRFRETKTGGVYEAKVWFPDGSGGRIPRYAYGRTLEDVAIAKADLLKQRRATPKRRSASRPKRLKVGEAAAMWITQHVAKLEFSTQEYYRVALAYRVAPYWYDTYVDEVDRRGVEQWMTQLLSEPRRDPAGRPIRGADGRPVPAHSPRNVNAGLATFKALFGKLIDWDLAPANPCQGVKKVAEPTGMIRVYEPSDVEEMALEHYRMRSEMQQRTGRGRRMKDERAELLAARDATMTIALAFTGLRLGELLALQLQHYQDGRVWRDGELVEERATGWLDVQQQVDAKTGRVKPYVKTKKARTVPVLPSVRRALDWWLALHPPHGPKAFLFPSLNHVESKRQGHLRQPRWRDGHFKVAAERAGFPDATPHELRHTFVSLMIARGVTPARLARWTGHSIEVMLNRYTHLYDRMEDDVLKNVDAALFLTPLVGSAAEGAPSEPALR